MKPFYIIVFSLILANSSFAQHHYAITGRARYSTYFDSNSVSNVTVTLSTIIKGDTLTHTFKTDSSGNYYIDTAFVKPLTTYTLTANPADYPYHIIVDTYNFTTPSSPKPASYNFKVWEIEGDVFMPSYSISFGFEDTTITKGQKDTALLPDVNYLKLWYGEVIEVDGNASQNEGNAAQRLAISKQRAQACRDYLISQGIDSLRIVVKGWGSTRPLITLRQIRRMKTKEEKAAAYQVNRRVTFHVLRFDYPKKD